MYKTKRHYRILGEETWNKIPQIVRDDLLNIVDEVGDMHHHNKRAEIWAALRNRGIETERTISVEGYSHAKRVNGYVECEATRVVIEIESSTIENAYNDTLKILTLKKIDAIEFGVVLAKYNPKRKSLSYEQLKKCLWDPFKPLIADELVILCVE